MGRTERGKGARGRPTSGVDAVAQLRRVEGPQELQRGGPLRRPLRRPVLRPRLDALQPLLHPRLDGAPGRAALHGGGGVVAVLLCLLCGV